MRIASWNVNSLKVRLPQVLDWVKLHQPDVLCLQETKLEDANFPVPELQAAEANAVKSPASICAVGTKARLSDEVWRVLVPW